MLILIVDDDSEDRELFHEAISEIDSEINCIAAKDGQEAIDLLTQELFVLPDFIFLDINMPLMNGQECLIELKKDPRLKKIPVIMYSTTSDTQEIKGYYALGAHDFLIKPNNFKKLVDALNSIIISTRTRR
jgi:CheY-like chemotaxis protein